MKPSLVILGVSMHAEAETCKSFICPEAEHVIKIAGGLSIPRVCELHYVY
jgi:hypothetical protein